MTSSFLTSAQIIAPYLNLLIQEAYMADDKLLKKVPQTNRTLAQGYVDQKKTEPEKPCRPRTYDQWQPYS